MSEIRIYFEGGGDSADTKAELRRGMGEFLGPLRERACERRWKWTLVPGGGRKQTYDAFIHARSVYPDATIILLVDSEAPVDGANPAEHLRRRDGWTFDTIPPEHLHLMAQCMEAWLVADPDALAQYYGQNFHRGSLPRRSDLEDEAKTNIYAALDAATRHTQKGPYGKIRHASDLLKRVDSRKSRQRCRHCERFFDALDKLIDRG